MLLQQAVGELRECRNEGRQEVWVSVLLVGDRSGIRGRRCQCGFRGKKGTGLKCKSGRSRKSAATQCCLNMGALLNSTCRHEWGTGVCVRVAILERQTCGVVVPLCPTLVGVGGAVMQGAERLMSAAATVAGTSRAGAVSWVSLTACARCLVDVDVIGFKYDGGGEGFRGGSGDAGLVRGRQRGWHVDSSRCLLCGRCCEGVVGYLYARSLEGVVVVGFENGGGGEGFKSGSGGAGLECGR